MSFRSSQSKEPLICHEPPLKPLEKVATGIFTFDGKIYLNVFQGYFEVDQSHSKTGAGIIKKMKKDFATYEIANTLLSDNRLPFNLLNLRTLCDCLESSVKPAPLATPKAMGGENAVKLWRTLLRRTKNQEQINTSGYSAGEIPLLKV